MKLEELKKRIAEQDGLCVCPVCGLPFKPYRKNQKTCAEPACQKQYHREYVKEYNRQKRVECPEIVREYNKLQMRKYRQKQREIKERDRQLQQMGEHWQRQEDFDKKVTEYGDRYGEIQKQKILESVPKIDLSMGGNNNGSEDDQDIL